MAANSGAKQPRSNSRKPAGHSVKGCRTCSTRRMTVDGRKAGRENSMEQAIASRMANSRESAADPNENRIVPARHTMAKAAMTTCPRSERTSALCSMTTANANPPSRKPVRSVIAGSCLLRVRRAKEEYRSPGEQRSKQTNRAGIRHRCWSGPAIHAHHLDAVFPEAKVEGRAHGGVDR